MARYYWDSSALIKYYHDEVGSPRVQQILGESSSEHLIARITAVELPSGLARKVRMGVIQSQDYDQLGLRFRADVQQGLLRPLRMLDDHFVRAGRLIDDHGTSQRLRAMDAIQLAVALHFHAAASIDHFVCADRDLCAVATSEGLVVIDPRQP